MEDISKVVSSFRAFPPVIIPSNAAQVASASLSPTQNVYFLIDCDFRLWAVVNGS